MRGAAGFSLIEVLVAFMILSLSLTALFQVFSTGLRSVGLSGEYTRAVQLAESELAANGRETALLPGEESGEWDGGLRWRRRVEAYPIWEEEPVPPPPATAYRVSVEVSWDGPRGPRRVTLDTLRLKGEVSPRGQRR